MSDLLARRPRATDLQTAMLSVAVLDWQSGPAKPGDEATGFGDYEGLPAKIALLADGRQARLVEAISYRQANTNKKWPVPAGAVIDGASIPRIFWTLMGGPFEGLYRDASIVHDYYCTSRSEPWKSVHRMFYEAMRSSGVPAAKAKIMYYAVYRFGPRWAMPGPMAAAVSAASQVLDDSCAASMEADAEAIFMHDLNLDEIDNLADARSARLPTPVAAAAGPVAASGPATLERVRLLVITGGQGTVEDVEAVAGEAVKLPGFVVAHFENRRIRIVACREGITDFERDLRGVIPRGWEDTGRTWDTVPGTYLQDDKRVVIATMDNGGQRVVPTSMTLRHGSANLVVHESLHGFDYSTGHGVLGEQRFKSARQDDLSRLRGHELLPGRAGFEETYAESGARFVEEPQAMQADWPNLFDYWAQQLGVSPGMSAAPDLEAAEDAALGTAELREDETIALDLRAEGPRGAIGHAVLLIAPAEPQYAALRQRLFDASLQPVPAAGPGTSASAAMPREVLFRPVVDN